MTGKLERPKLRSNPCPHLCVWGGGYDKGRALSLYIDNASIVYGFNSLRFPSVV